MEASVRNLVKQVKKGDQNAFGEIVEIYKDSLYQVCYRILGNRQEAEDAAQEAFIRAYVNINSFNIELKFSTWIFRIATNLCIDRIRRKKPDFYLDAEVSGTQGLTMYSQIASEDPLTEARVESMELQDTIQKEILKLPEKYRIAIVLKYIEDLSLNEISEILDLPLGTVKTRIHRGRDLLRKQLQHV
ncbi:MAG: RNA polymerase sigma factor SigW [Bacillota bacterium]|nr:RNA polymerase sigma factor SigW [Bacillota bacterium]MDP4171660.1 RNA polymerase sigma factor SigW [Bacillota bacterium]